MAVTLALAGDTMLGRCVAQRLATAPPAALVDEPVAALLRGADFTLLNLECCVSERGEPWPAPGKPFFFRAPPVAVKTLTHLGVDCVTLANNHALDFGYEALLDTLELVRSAGIVVLGAGRHVREARAPTEVLVKGVRLGLVAFADHPADFAAGRDRPGTAYADLERGVPAWLTDQVAALARTCDAVLVTPHWGPNMTPGPVRTVREAANALLAAGATLIAGHSAHVPHGVRVAEDGRAVLYDLGDFLDDYAVDARLRNDLGLVFLVTLDAGRVTRIEAVPLYLDFCFTRLATGADADWMRRRFHDACASMGTVVTERDGRLVITPP
ncbi:CapA family protein [Carbonactinospora thermoautotrophica]|uniref:Poly-gamma-glutamate biosynthesis protein n=1 Tax=Carbonactinospora thermoautotrophica TaxID=1469144 RepID=A0A132N1Q4_9ACTN|nr:CapA family protein [Carbonactinospora thermoautotrophica]KWW99594.1 Poly-gamma-glutamate biosynthesis protein [Carbonactinospora thermoautotrophica]KWX04023.1 poly-gamma-glutamate biosynthesis protein [Carbonactinospora thermoautotrophica]MCX9191834.1 CapA family protein [Carbonactinospora thermoautotrophica]